MIVPASHLVRVVQLSPEVAVSGMLATDELADIQGGRGGWQATSRTRRSAFVEWIGPEVETYELALLMVDGATSNVDEAHRALVRMSRMPREGAAPPIIRVDGRVPIHGRRWAINDLVFSGVQRNTQGRYTRFVATMSLIAAEALGDGVVVATRAPGTFRTTAAVNTLQKVSMRFYGSTKHAAMLGKAQAKPIRDVRRKLKPNTMLVIP